MKALTVQQGELAKRRALYAVPLLRIDTTDGRTFGFSDTSFTYDGVEYAPFLERLDPFVESMLHYQDPGITAQGQLYRDFTFVLRNGETNDTEAISGNPPYRRKRLIEVLYDGILELSTVTISQLLLDRYKGDSEQQAIADADAASLVPTVFYRGELGQVTRVSNEEIDIRCSSIQPQGGMGNALVLNDIDENGVFSIGRRHSVIYGDVKQLPVNSVNRTTETTLAQPVNETATTLFVTDGSRFSASGGTLVMGGELLTYGAKDQNRLTQISRGLFGSQAVQHAAGELVTGFPEMLRLSAGLNVSEVDNLYFVNPLSQKRYLVTSPWTDDVVTDGSTGEAYRAVEMTTADLIAQTVSAVEQAAVTQQAEYEDPASTSTTSDVETEPTGAFFNEPTGLSADKGDWTSATDPTWSYDALKGKRQASIAFQASDFSTNRTVFAVRAYVKWRLDDYDFPGPFSPPGRFTVSASLPDNGVSGLATAGAVIDLSPLPTTPVESDQVYGSWDTVSGLTEQNFIGSRVLLTARAGNGQLRSGDTFDLTVLEFGIEMRVLDTGGTVITRVVDATIDGVAGAFGSESFATVDAKGPTVPGVQEVEYDFDDETGWSAPLGTISGTGDPLTFTANIPSSTVVYDIATPGNLDSWTLVNGETGESLAYDASLGGRAAWKLTTTLYFFADTYVEKANFASADWSGGTILVDMWVSNTTFSIFEMEIEDGAANVARWRFFSSELTANEWMSLPLDDDHLVSDDGVDFTDVDKMRTYTYPNIAITYEIGLSRISVSNSDLIASFLKTGITAFDPDTTGDYLLDCEPSNLSNVSQVLIRLAEDETLAKRREIVWLASAMVEGTRASYLATLVQDIGTPNMASITAVQVRISVINNNDPMPALDIWGLLSEEDAVGYVGDRDDLIEHPADVCRYHLTEACGLPATAIDASSFSDAETNLGSNKVACIATLMAENDSDFLAYLGQQHRFQLVQSEGQSGTLYKLLTAEADYTFPASIRTLAFGNYEVELEGYPATTELVNRRAYLFDVDYAIGTSTEAFRQALNVSTTKNDLSAGLDTLLQDSEDNYGPRAGATQTFVAVSDPDTAKDVAEYYMRETLRLPKLYRLSDIPWVDAYDLERGDIISFRTTWEGATGPLIKARIIEYDKDWASERIALTVVEVL